MSGGIDMSAYPTAEQVEAADVRQLLGWVRGLPSPDDEHRPLLDRIIERMQALREQDPSAYVSASKSLMRGPGE
ncbi:MAG: hypothetical protein QOF36_2591 [Microbacteriaceae bacterium]|nr:hypothetical protein [Microbacteriaceae bacterium]